MDTPTNDEPGEKPAAEQVAPEVGEKPPAADDTLSQFDGIPDEDIYAMLEAAEKAESGPDQDAPEATSQPEQPEAAQPESQKPEQEETPAGEPKAGDKPKTEAKAGEEPEGQPKPPERVSVRGLPPEQRIETAAALNLIRNGEAKDLADALAILRKDSTPEPKPDPKPEGEGDDPPAAEKQPPAADTPRNVAEIKSKIDQLRADRDEADEAFDRPEVRRITREIEDLSLDLIRAESAEKEQQAQARTWEEKHEAACAEVESKYPDAADDDSTFSRLLADKVDAAYARRDPATSDPAFIAKFADEVAQILGTKGQTTAAKETTTKPKAPPVPTGRDVAPGHQSAARATPADVSRAIDQMSDEDAFKLMEETERLMSAGKR